MTKVRLLALVTVMVLAGAACGSEETPDGTSDPGDEGSNGDVATISVEAFDFGFEPNSISVDAGEEVEIEFENTGDAPHTFTSDELGVDIRTSAGGSGNAAVTAPEDGTYGFACSIHPQMQGEIIVGTGGAGAGDDGTTEGEAENDDGTSESGADGDEFDY